MEGFLSRILEKTEERSRTRWKGNCKLSNVRAMGQKLDQDNQNF